MEQKILRLYWRTCQVIVMGERILWSLLHRLIDESFPICKPFLHYRDILSPFLVYIKFHMIPASVLMTEIHPLGLVPYK